VAHHLGQMVGQDLAQPGCVFTGQLPRELVPAGVLLKEHLLDDVGGIDLATRAGA
jgi:hypothetical protein